MADYQARWPELDAAGVDVIFASGDAEQDARRTVEELRPGFPVAWGLDVRAFAAATGCFWSEQKNHLHATGFLLRPGGKVVLAVYSSGALGRLSPQDVFTILPFLQPKKPAH